jgi:hypothetical protein
MTVVGHRNNPRETWRPGVETRMLVSASNGAAHLCIFEQWIAPGPALHVLLHRTSKTWMAGTTSRP